MSPIEITANQRGFHQYGEPVRTAYGDMVEVYESSSAEAPHCWLRIDGSTSALTDQKGRDMAAHLNLEQAVAIRDRLDAWIGEVPTRWGCETEARIAELSPRTVDEAGRERARSAMARILNDTGRVALGFEVVDESLDRIIDALGYTVAPQPKPERARDYFDTLVQDGHRSPTPAPATPAVELTPEELRSAAAIVDAFRELHTQTCKLDGEAVDAVPSTWPLPIIDAQLPVAVACGEADWVLRIGGGDE